MATRTRTIEVPPGSELTRLLDDMAGLPIELVKDGVRYRLHRAEESGVEEIEEADKDYDPEMARRAFRRAVGAWANIDADRLIDELYRAREEGTRVPGLRIYEPR